MSGRDYDRERMAADAHLLRDGKGRGAVALLLFALALGGCSNEGPTTVPVECKAGPQAVRSALASAPEPVTLDGVPLSGCLTRASDAGDLQAVGAAYVEVAAELATDARRDPEGPAAEQLGYLTGAVRRGAATTQGIHEELRRRLEQELSIVDTGSAAFQEGERAGRATG